MLCDHAFKRLQQQRQARAVSAGARESAAAQPGPRAGPPWLLSLLVWLLALPLLSASLVNAPQVLVDVGAWGDHTALRGVNMIEQATGETYRWTTGYASLSLPNLGERYRMLRMRAHGWRPGEVPAPALRIEAAGYSLGPLPLKPEMRLYSILLPSAAGHTSVKVGLATEPVFYAPNDPRQLGFALDWIALAEADRSSPPALAQLGGQALLLGLGMLLLLALALPSGWTLALSTLLATALPWANFQHPLWVAQSLGPWLLLAALLLAATCLLRSILRQALLPWATLAQANVAWALFVAALALRLGGAAHPLFDAHDLPVHTRWLDTVAGGEIYLYSTPAELRNQQTFNPPAGYLLLLPLRLLLPDDRLSVQLGVALLDALACLLLLAIARELRFTATAGLLAMGLALALPIGMTMLWWGFAANNIAQVAWLLLLWALLRTTRRPSLLLTSALGVLLLLCLLTHAGAMVLTVAMLGLLLPIAWPRLARPSRRALLGAIGVAALFALPVYFTAVVGPVLEQELDPQTKGLAATLEKARRDLALRLALVGRGWSLGYLVPTLGLAPLGLVLLGQRRRHPLVLPLLITWIVVSALFFLAYLSLALLTRYIYFAAPLICLAVASVLAELRRRPTGRLVALTLVLLVALSGATLWAEGVLLRIKPSVVPLSH
jgi:toxin CptA